MKNWVNSNVTINVFTALFHLVLKCLMITAPTFRVLLCKRLSMTPSIYKMWNYINIAFQATVRLHSCCMMTCTLNGGPDMVTEGGRGDLEAGRRMPGRRWCVSVLRDGATRLVPALCTLGAAYKWLVYICDWPLDSLNVCAPGSCPHMEWLVCDNYVEEAYSCFGWVDFILMKATSTFCVLMYVDGTVRGFKISK